MSVTPAPSVAGMVSFASDVTSRRAVLTVSSDSNRPDIRAKTADNSPARGRSWFIGTDLDVSLSRTAPVPRCSRVP
ncbi:MAG: hypothetical protein ABJC62_01930, partial [Frankiaceae bacterium]